MDWPGCNYRKRKYHQLSVAEKVDMVHDVLIEKDSFAYIAKKYRVNKQLIDKLMKKVKTNKRFFKELNEK